MEISDAEVERVAKVMHRAQERHYRELLQTEISAWTQNGPRYHARMKVMARAAIKALQPKPRSKKGGGRA